MKTLLIIASYFTSGNDVKDVMDAEDLEVVIKTAN